MNITITEVTRRELTEAEEKLIFMELNKQRDSWTAFIREGDNYGEDPEEDKFLEGSFDQNIVFETEQVIKDLVKVGKLTVMNEGATTLSTETYVKLDNEEEESK